METATNANDDKTGLKKRNNMSVRIEASPVTYRN